MFTLKPDEGIEYKLTMKKGHAVTFDQGILTAAYDGGHGWFWRNRGSRDVTVTLQVKGAFSQIKRMN